MQFIFIGQWVVSVETFGFRSFIKTNALEETICWRGQGTFSHFLPYQGQFPSLFSCPGSTKDIFFPLQPLFKIMLFPQPFCVYLPFKCHVTCSVFKPSLKLLSFEKLTVVLKKQKTLIWTWWHILRSLETKSGEPGQNNKFQASLGYLVRLSQKYTHTHVCIY